MNSVTILANGMVVAGTSLLVFSLILVRRMARQLPAGGIRRRWGLLTAMIIAFVPGTSPMDRWPGTAFAGRSTSSFR